MIRVDGYQNLYRDEKTGAIINCDNIEYQNHLNRLSHKNIQKNELDKMKKDIEEIKLLLKEIINGSK
jgi:hypothetical protein